ncbi:hypothetical protein [Acetobacter oeni]|uniref:Uncharacterized protein n=1 Tax=Acetobacter oeni TaxID=304077 RepID=A0A511XHT3_9PROT|nr:hypothetical protein [Acetobacter oeni]MBB3882559.1 hypothetical protein [Acetobacter oeni]NHO18630.1 hypothetical protein [Acetobacter oeni]GBR11952.1 hypothetical protein AA21952_3506 [Acetobacter oeni LMG 21952]GEN62504.1 hypothetical protein AOE01nite_07280 [Acetobacter oeni]
MVATYLSSPGLFRFLIAGAVLLGVAGFLSGCQDYEKAALTRCSKTQPDMTLMRDGDMTDFLTPCGLQGFADATDRVRLHYQPPRGDGTIPVSANTNFAVSEEGGSRGRVWYLCMPVPALPVMPPPPAAGSRKAGTGFATASGRNGSGGVPPGAVPLSQPSQQAVCRYAGSGAARMTLVYDRNDAATHDPRTW